MEETGQTVQETPKVQAEQTGENGKNVGMSECETMELIMESRSENEEFARVVAAVFASRRHKDSQHFIFLIRRICTVRNPCLPVNFII